MGGQHVETACAAPWALPVPPHPRLSLRVPRKMKEAGAALAMKAKSSPAMLGSASCTPLNPPGPTSLREGKRAGWEATAI